MTTRRQPAATGEQLGLVSAAAGSACRPRASRPSPARADRRRCSHELNGGFLRNRLSAEEKAERERLTAEYLATRPRATEATP